MKRRPDVVHVSSAHPANDPRIFEKECRTLAAAGYAVHLVATGVAPASDDVTVSIVSRPAGRVQRMTAGAFGAVVEALRTRAPVVHLHDPELALWIPLLRLAGRKVVFDSHEDIAASVSTKDYLSTPMRLVLTTMCRLLVRFIDRSSTAVVSATPSISKGFHNRHTSVVQNFPTLGEFPMKNPGTDATRLLYIGGLNRARGARQMIEALELVGNTHPSVSLTIAGKITDDLLGELSQLAGWQYVDFRGLVDRSGVNALLANSDIGLVLFQPEPNHIESQPTKMFEYMIGGLALVASDFPHWRSLVMETGVGRVVDPTDPAAIARTLGDLLDQPEAVPQMGRLGRDLVMYKHNWDVEGAKLVDLYSEIGARRS